MHIPVLKQEVIEYLNPRPNENFIDCTFGEGGHSAAILEKIAPKGRVLGIDLCARLSLTHPRLILVRDNFVNLKEIARKNKFGPVSGILFDLGYSSWHLEESGRGFSFQKREPLDMRYNPQDQLTAEKIINFWSRNDIEKILKEYGQEPFAGQIAKRIVEARRIRPIKNTFQLAEIIKGAVSRSYLRQKINPATRTFQALRITVNDELNNLEKVLPQSLEILKPGGRLAVISFHSLEDRIIKNFLREKAKGELPACNALPARQLDGSRGGGRSNAGRPAIKILTKKPITPSNKEITLNPRSRSAKLRAAVKL